MASIFQRLFGERVTPKTRAVTHERSPRFFSKRNRDENQLARYENIYRQGGIITTAIDTYALYVMANGYHLEGSDDDLVEYTQTRLDQMNFESVCMQGIVDAMVFGDCFQEKVYNRKGEVLYVLPRSAKSFDIVHDEYGRVSGYTQTYSEGHQEKQLSIDPKYIISFPLFKTGGSMYGRGIIPAAYDDIMRDVKTAEATTAAVERHGFRKWHAKVGREGESVPEDVLNTVAEELEDLNSTNEIITPYDVDINTLDAGPLGNVAEINHSSIDRLLSALGVPGELIGLAWGSTEATAKVKKESFLLRCAAIQKQVARAYNIQLIDDITGKPGAVRHVFNDIDPEDEKQRAEWIGELISKTPLDPWAILPQDWVRAQFGIEGEG
jgi:hypothetical protein